MCLIAGWLSYKGDEGDMNECYHNSWLAGWMYEGDMRLFFVFFGTTLIPISVGVGSGGGRPAGWADRGRDGLIDPAVWLVRLRNNGIDI